MEKLVDLEYPNYRFSREIIADNFILLDDFYIRLYFDKFFNDYIYLLFDEKNLYVFYKDFSTNVVKICHSSFNKNIVDMIISVGKKINSKRIIHYTIFCSSCLKLNDGYSI